MTVVVALAALLRRGWKVDAGIVAGPAAVYALWFALEGDVGPAQRHLALHRASVTSRSSCGGASPSALSELDAHPLHRRESSSRWSSCGWSGRLAHGPATNRGRS